jgi:hypothetical protein
MLPYDLEIGKTMSRKEHDNGEATVPRRLTFLCKASAAIALLLTVAISSVALAQNAGNQVTDTLASADELVATARASFAASDAEKGREQLTSALRLYRDAFSADQGPEGKRRWSAKLLEVAYEYLRGGELREATLVLGEAADLEVPPMNEVDDGLAATVGAWHRQLALLDADARFELLYQWSLPTKTRKAVRALSSIVPHEAPPAVFARALGERPRKESFQVASVGDVSGLFSSAWSLVESAADAGRLRGLTNELEALVGDEVPNARFVLTLAEIIQLEGELDEALAQRLDERILQTDAALKQPREGSQQIDTQSLVIAATSLSRQPLAARSERLLKSLIEYTYGGESFRMRAFLRVALAKAIRNRLADSSSDVLADPRLRLWIPSDRTTASSSGMGCVGSMWLAHEDHILHLAGPDNSVLFFCYPLTGDFQFSCEAQDGGREGTEGGLEYGGLGFEDWGGGWVFKARDADLVHIFEQPSPYVPHSRVARFHRVAIQSNGEGFNVLSNGHPLWRDASPRLASPWIGLRSFRDRRPVFRNLKLTGSATIPREVRMSDGDVLRGWRAGCYGERLPSPFATTLPRLLTECDWFLHEGIIHGMKRSRDDAAGIQSRLEYARPLLDGESVSYEFHYEPGEYEVHPALGRLAFLIVSAGVRIHWMTDGDREWSCLREDNAIVEPLNRRGPKPLPLNEGGWNRVSMALSNGKVSLSLNNTTIYVRDVGSDDPATFAFYRNRTQCSARIRNVVMRGDWPERLTDEQLNNLAATDVERSPAERHALHTMFEEPNVAANVIEVSRRAAELNVEAKFQLLSRWVLPGEDHPGFRLAGDFTPTKPVGNVVGGDFVAPALDLIDVANQLGRLDELRTRVEGINASVDAGYKQRARIALLYLIDVARDDVEAARANLGQLIDSIRESDHNRIDERWPETLALARGVDYPGTRETIAELFYVIYGLYANNRRGWRSLGSKNWDYFFFSLLGAHKLLLSGQPTLDQFNSAPPLENWLPVSLATSRTRGDGLPRPHWQAGKSQVNKYAGHEQDFLFFRMPLRGEYEVECELTPAAWRTIELSVAGTWVGPYWNRKAYVLGNFREEQPQRQVEPQIASPDEWARYRAVVRGGVCTTYFNGRKLHEEPVVEASDPWLAIRGTARSHGAVRNLRITGNPIVPEQIELATIPDLPGWIPYFEDTVSRDGDWRPYELSDGGGIVGVVKPELAGTLKESMLRYHRPMIEDGTIEYEFYYELGKADVHPALDCLALILEPAGVHIHWVTNGKYDCTGMDPANRFTEPANRRGSERFPLKQADWNHVRLTLRGDTAQLELNNELVYERELEPTNQRTFGLFHYADQTEARVRNIVWRGDWSKHLPPLGEQELAAPDHESLHELENLSELITHDFTRSAVPAGLFELTGFNVEEAIAPLAEGLRMKPPVRDAWTSARVTLRKPIYGDFDATLRFANLRISYGNRGTASLSLNAVDETGIVINCARSHTVKDRILCSARMSMPLPDKTKRLAGKHLTDETTSGILRLVRRGATIHALIAHEDSPNFRYIGSHGLPSAGTAVRIQISAGTVGNGSVDVLLKELNVRSNSSAIEAQVDPRVIALGQYTLALPDRYVHSFAAGTDGGFSVPGEPQAVVAEDGVKMRVDGRNDVRQVVVAFRRGIMGDFDVSTGFKTLNLPTVVNGEGSIDLSVRTSSDNQKQATLTLSKSTDREFRITAQTQPDSRTIVEAKAESVDGLRIIRIQRTVFFLYSESGFFRLLGQADLGTGDVERDSVRLTTRASTHSDAATEVLLKVFEIKASELVRQTMPEVK